MDGGDAIDRCNNSKAVEGVSSRCQDPSTELELEAHSVFVNRSKFSEQSVQFLRRGFMKKGNGCRAMVYQALVDHRRQSHFKDLDSKEVDYHLHVAALHNWMTQTKSKDVCIMAKHIKLQSDHEKKQSF